MSFDSARRSVLAMLACALVASSSALAQDPRAAVVQRAAREWLALVDKLDAEASWTAAGARFQQATPRANWSDRIRREREPRGALVQRAAAGTEFRDSAPGLPPGGNYALVSFHSSFEKETDGREDILLEVGADYAWHVIGYAIR